MQKKSSFRRVGAFALTLIFTTAWWVNSLHDFFLHHEHPVCEAAFDGKGVHIHDERYEGNACSLCVFVLSSQALISILTLPSYSPKLPNSESPNFYHSPVESKTACDSTLRRGPPVI